ncbi:hypothetical protein [Erwinia tracheiphila]|uniref:hypothetical protein n=1 Tax=Erwinia tracheiphila TaxID=65700 RepID=UPI0026D97B11|nr:hypothetical protein [Erwinia tracheiphila]
MAKAWKDVIASPQYQQLSPAQKSEAQEQYFNEVVAPRAGDQASQAKAAFYSAYPSPGQQQQSQPDNPFLEAGKGLAQSAVNMANIIPEVGDAVQSAAAWAGGKLGMGDGTFTPAQRFALPDALQPNDEYAKIGAEIGPYLIPGVGAERTAAALGSAASAGRAERFATKAADMLAENVPGALAQNSSADNPEGLAKDLAIDTLASGAVRAVVPAVNGIASVIKQGIRPAEKQAVSAGVEPEVKSAFTPEQEKMQDAIRDISNSKNPDLASSLNGLDLKPRQDVITAAERLGVADDLLPSHLSGNAQYQAVEQAIKSRKGSVLRVQEDRATAKLAENAGKMIDDVAGLPDALAMNEHFIGKVDNRMASLERRSDQLYSRVDSALPSSSKVEAVNTARHLENQADELGGWENLDPIEQKVFKAVNPGPEGRLTYANLNKQRRMVGQALYKKSGPYKDADEDALSRLYGQLSEDQRSALGEVSARRDFEVAQRLVQMRKNLEEKMVSLRGKNLTGDVTTKASAALSSMAKGSGKDFRELMMNIPSRQMRSEIVATGIRDMLSAGKRGADFNPGGYADWYQNMMKNGNIRLLEPHLPTDMKKGLRDLYTVADAIRRAKAHEVATGALNDFTKRFDRVTASHDMMAKYAAKVGTMAGAQGGSLGALAGSAIGARLAEKARIAGGSASSEAAEKLISSPAYQAAFRSQAGKSTAGKIMESESQLRSSSEWREFFGSLPEKERRTLARMGIIGWIVGDE